MGYVGPGETAGHMPPAAAALSTCPGRPAAAAVAAAVAEAVGDAVVAGQGIGSCAGESTTRLQDHRVEYACAQKTGLASRDSVTGPCLGEQQRCHLLLLHRCIGAHRPNGLPRGWDCSGAVCGLAC